MTNRKFRGSFTVEAALLLPMIIFIIYAMILLAFYLHDRNSLEGAVDEILHKGALTLKHEADLASGSMKYENIGDRGVFYLLFGETKQQEEEILDYLWERSGKGLFLMEVTDIQVEVNTLKLKITLTGEFEVPVKGLLEFFYPDRIVTVEAERSIHNPAEFIRIADVVLNTGSRIKGIANLKGMVDKVLGR